MHLNSTIILLAESIEQALSIDELCWSLTKNCISQLNFENCIVYLLDEKKNKLIQQSAVGTKNSSIKTVLTPIEIPIGEGIVGSVAKYGVAELVNDTHKDKYYTLADEKGNSKLTVPIKSGAKVIGIINSEHSAKGFFTIQHLYILTVISSFLTDKLKEITLQLSPPEKLFPTLDRIKKISEQEQNYLLLSTQSKIYKISKNEIIRVEAAGNYCVLYTLGELKIMLAKTLKTLEKEINSSVFIRAHKSHLVNLNYIEECKNNELILSDKTVIAVSVRKLPFVKKALLNL